MRCLTKSLLVALGAMAAFLVLPSSASAQPLPPRPTCANFATQRQAQAYFDTHPDAINLVPGGTGPACPALPVSVPPTAVVATPPVASAASKSATTSPPVVLAMTGVGSL